MEATVMTLPQRSVVGLDDANEASWMFVSLPKEPAGRADQLAAKLRLFRYAAKYAYCYVRVSIRNGSASLTVHATSEPDDPPLRSFDLDSVVNVVRRSVGRRRALPFVSHDEDRNPVTEPVFGHIAVALQFATTPEARRAVFATGLGGGSGSSGGGGAAAGGSAGGGSIAGAVFGGGTSPRRGGHGADADRGDDDGFGAPPPFPGVEELRLAFPSTDARDRWEAWLAEIVVLRELWSIEHTDADARWLAGDDPGGCEWPEDLPLGEFALTTEGQRAVRDYVRYFLQGSSRRDGADRGGGGGDGGLPNNGKLLARPPNGNAFVEYRVSGNSRRCVVDLARKRASMLHPSPASISVSLAERSLVFAPFPWSCEFQLVLDESRMWAFQASSFEQRDAWIAWFRTIKGRGTLAQTEKETFPFLASVEANAGAMEETTERNRLQVVSDSKLHFIGGAASPSPRSAGGAPSPPMSPSLSPSPPTSGSPARDAGHVHAANTSFSATTFAGGGGVTVASVPSLEDSLSSISTPRHSSSEEESVCGGDDENADSNVATAGANAARAQTRRRQPLWQRTQSPANDWDGDSDGHSVLSVRPFRPFPTFAAFVLEPFVAETCAPHLLGRSAAVRRVATVGVAHGMVGASGTAVLGSPRTGAILSLRPPVRAVRLQQRPLTTEARRQAADQWEREEAAMSVGFPIAAAAVAASAAARPTPTSAWLRHSRRPATPSPSPSPTRRRDASDSERETAGRIPQRTAAGKAAAVPFAAAAVPTPTTPRPMRGKAVSVGPRGSVFGSSGQHGAGAVAPTPGSAVTASPVVRSYQRFVEAAAPRLGASFADGPRAAASRAFGGVAGLAGSPSMGTALRRQRTAAVAAPFSAASRGRLGQPHQFSLHAIAFPAVSSP